MQQICNVLSLPPDFFTATAGPMIGKAEASNGQAGTLSHDVIQQFLGSREGQRLVESFMRIQDKRLRTRILDFVASVSDDEA